jgi:hypothetical protein
MVGKGNKIGETMLVVRAFPDARPAKTGKLFRIGKKYFFSEGGHGFRGDRLMARQLPWACASEFTGVTGDIWLKGVVAVSIRPSIPRLRRGEVNADDRNPDSRPQVKHARIIAYQKGRMGKSGAKLVISVSPIRDR